MGVFSTAGNRAVLGEGPLEVFTTCPSSANSEPNTYLKTVANVANWSEAIGCRGILVYTDNSLVDPWLVSQTIIEQTDSLCPLVAVQPVYMHPYSVAKMITSLGFLHRRRIYLNMVAGGFRNDLLALNDPTPHDRRYERIIEYSTIIASLLKGDRPLTFEGEFFQTRNLKLTPRLPKELFPGLFMSGSSDAGRKAALAIGATAVEYPAPAAECEAESAPSSNGRGLRVGIVARDKEQDAWKVAHSRFPVDRKGELQHQLAMKVSDSKWHRRLSDLGDQQGNQSSVYWLIPFKHYKTFCPYLVGSYKQVAAEICGYIKAGFRSFILDIPPDADELHHTNMVFGEALRGVSAA